MATHIQSTGVQSSGAVTSQGKAFTSNITAGNRITVVIALFRNSIGSPGVTSVTDNLGNTYVQRPSAFVQSAVDTHCGMDIWECKNITTGGTCTVTVTPNASSFTSFGITENSGSDTASPDDGVSTNTGTSTTPSTGNQTRSNAGIDFGGVTHTGATTTITEDTGAGWTLVFEAENATNQPINVEYKIAASGTLNPDWTLGASRDWIATGSGFKDSSGTAPVLQPLMVDPGFLPILAM
jgi:hypothetical protein